MFDDLKNENTVFDILSDFHTTRKRLFVTENLTISVSGNSNKVVICAIVPGFEFEMSTWDFAAFLAHQLGFDCFESDEKFMETIKTWGLCFDGDLSDIIKKFFESWQTKQGSVVMSCNRREFSIWIDNSFSTWGTF